VFTRLNTASIILRNQIEDPMDILEFVDVLAGFGLVTSRAWVGTWWPGGGRAGE
jgi:hypothetical protein